jgi:hypothetical protein
VEQVAAEIHLDEAPTMEELQRYDAGEPIPGQVKALVWFWIIDET